MDGSACPFLWGDSGCLSPPVTTGDSFSLSNTMEVVVLALVCSVCGSHSMLLHPSVRDGPSLGFSEMSTGVDPADGGWPESGRLESLLSPWPVQGLYRD